MLAATLWLIATGARADIKVTVEGIEGAARNNIESLLSLTRFRDRDDIDEDFAQRLYKRIDGEVKDAVRPFGYYEPKVEADPPRAEGKDWHFHIRVTPGMPVYVNKVNISITGPGADDHIFDGVRRQTSLESGGQLYHESYEAVKGEMTRAAAANGYLDARLLGDENLRFVVDPTMHTADIDLQLDTGPRYSFGKVEIDQDVIRPSLMRRFLRFQEGDPYYVKEVLDTQFALDDSLYFSSVDVTLEDPDRQNHTVPVRIKATKGRAVYEIGGGYGTDTGLRGTLGWTNNRINDRGHRLRFELKASATTRRIDSRYDIPIGDPALERFSIEALNRVEPRSDLDTNESTIRPSITRVHGLWQTVTSLSFTHTTTDDGDSRFTSNLVVPGIVLASVPEGFLGESLFNREFYAELIGSHSTLGSDADFLRLDLQAEKKFDLAPKWHLLLRGEFGTSVVSRFSEVPGIYRFFAGGDRSVRGFAYNSLSPDDTGGRHLIVGSTEVVRDLPRNFGVAAFFDIGNAFNSFKDPLEYAAGAGFRYRLEVAAIGLDLAQPLSTNGKLRIHLNIATKL